MSGESNLSMQQHAPITGGVGDGRVPTILQVLPSLVTGGVERGAADVSTALVQAGDCFMVWARCVSVAGDAINRRRMSMRRGSANSLILSKDFTVLNFFISIKFFLIRESVMPETISSTSSHDKI